MARMLNAAAKYSRSTSRILRMDNLLFASVHPSCRTTAKLADELRGLGIYVCPQTVARLLKAMGYSLRVNRKKLAGASNPNRDQRAGP